MSKTVSFEIEAGLAEFEVASYQAPTPATRDDPGDGGEVELAAQGTLTDEDGRKTRISYDALVDGYAAMHGVDRDRARQMIEDEAMDEVGQAYADDYDDAVLSYMEGEDY